MARWLIQDADKWGCINPPFALEAFYPAPKTGNIKASLPQQSTSVLMPCHDKRMLRETLQSLDSPLIAEVLIHPDGFTQADLQGYVDGVETKSKYKKTVIEPFPDLQADLTKGIPGNIGRVKDELLKLAEGQYVMCFDADDVLQPAILDQAIYALEDEPDLEGVFWHHALLPIQHHWITPTWRETPTAITTRLDTYLAFRLFQTGCVLWRTDFLKTVQTSYKEMNEPLHEVNYCPTEYGLVFRVLNFLRGVNGLPAYPQLAVLPLVGSFYRKDWSEVSGENLKTDYIELGNQVLADELCKAFPTGLDLCIEVDSRLERDQKIAKNFREMDWNELDEHFGSTVGSPLDA
jgi:hypothetical protein